MGGAKELWIAEHERACDDLWETGDTEAFTAEMKRLGFDQSEIADHVDAWREDTAPC